MAYSISIQNQNTALLSPEIGNHDHENLDLIESTSADFYALPRFSQLSDMNDLISTDYLADVYRQETALQAQARIERDLFSDFEGGLYGALANHHGEYKMPEGPHITWKDPLILHRPHNKIIPAQNRNQNVEMIDTDESAKPEPSTAQQAYSDEGLNVLKALQSPPSTSAKKFNAAQHNPFNSHDPFAFESAHEIAVFRIALTSPNTGAQRIREKLEENGVALTKAQIGEAMSKYELNLYDMVKINSRKTKRVDKIDQRPLLNDKYQSILTDHQNDEDLLQKIQNHAFSSPELKNGWNNLTQPVANPKTRVN